MTAERWQCVRASGHCTVNTGKICNSPAAATAEGCSARTSKRREKNRIPRARGRPAHNEAKNITGYDNYCPRSRFIAGRCRERRGAYAFFSPILAFSPIRVSHRSFIYQLYAARCFTFFFFLYTPQLEATMYSYFRTFAHGRAMLPCTENFNRCDLLCHEGWIPVSRV